MRSVHVCRCCVVPLSADVCVCVCGFVLVVVVVAHELSRAGEADVDARMLIFVAAGMLWDDL